MLEISNWKAFKNILRSCPPCHVKDDTVSPHLHSANMKLDQRGYWGRCSRPQRSATSCLVLHLPESYATQYHGLSIAETTHCWPLRKLFTLILAPGLSLSFGCGFSLAVEIDGFASNLLPAVFTGVLQSHLWCHCSYFYWPDYLSPVTNLNGHSSGIQFSWSSSQRRFSFNLQ